MTGEWGWDQLLVSAVSILTGSVVLGTVGFGMGLTAAPVMLTLIDPVTVVVSLNTLGLMMYSLALYQSKAHLEFKSTTPTALAGLIALPIGIILLTIIDFGILRLTIAIGILFFAIGFTLKFQYVLPKFKGGGVLVGFIVGLLLVTLGIGGPILVIFMLSMGANKETYRANIAYFMVIVELGCIVGYILGGMFSFNVLILIGFMVVPMLFGYVISKSIFYKLNENAFRNTVAIVIIAGSFIVITKEIFSHLN